MIAEQAGGASDGHRRIMDIEPQDIHQRAPLFIGSKYRWRLTVLKNSSLKENPESTFFVSRLAEIVHLSVLGDVFGHGVRVCECSVGCVWVYLTTLQK